MRGYITDPAGPSGLRLLRAVRRGTNSQVRGAGLGSELSRCRGATGKVVSEARVARDGGAPRRVQLAGNEGSGYGSVRLASAVGRWVLAVAVLGDAMILLEATVVNVALPTIGRDLHAGVAGLQWTLNGYVLTLAALVLVGGSLSDIYGRRRVFILGVVAFVAASALCAAAPTIGLLIAGRFVQGIGGALLTPGSLAIIDAVFHPDDRTRAIGAWAGLGAVAGAIGPTVGGYLTDAVSWRAVFLINVPLGVFVVVAAVLHVPETRDPTRAGLDLRGAALATLAIAGACFALTEASGGLTPAVIAAAAAGLAAAAAFVAVERRARHPMLPLELFRSRQFASANLLALVTYVALGGVIFLFVAFLQVTLGYTALQAGAATLPITVLLLTLSTPSGTIVQRIGPRIPLTVGAVLTGAGLLLMAQLHPGDRYLTAVLPALVVFGVGLAALITPITATVLASVDSRHSGIASAVNNALSRLGQMIAVAALPLAAGLSGSAFEDPARMAAGFPVAMTVAAGASFAAALLAWTTISSDVLSRSSTGSQRVPKELPPSLKRHCPVAGTPLAASLNTPAQSPPSDG
jgi:EmrB/QacA subfamily drug resistance transporter